jgi:hypothetical protein
LLLRTGNCLGDEGFIIVDENDMRVETLEMPIEEAGKHTNILIAEVLQV